MKRLMTKRLLFILAFFMPGAIHLASAQFTPGARFGGNVTTLRFLHIPTSGESLSSFSSSGIGPYFNIESKRFIMQFSYMQYFSSEVISYQVVDATGSVKIKPNELSMIFGYKINANKPARFYPLVGFNKYTMGIRYKERISPDEVVTYNDQVNLYGFSAGIGAQYEYKRFIFDIQAKASYLLGEYTEYQITGSNVDIGAGLGYLLSKK